MPGTVEYIGNERQIDVLLGDQHPPAFMWYFDRLDDVLRGQNALSDPVVAPLVDQVRNQLSHSVYRFRVATDSTDYFPYEIEPQVPPGAVDQATHKADRLFALFNSADQAVASEISLPPSYGEQARQVQQEIVDNLLADPLTKQADFQARRREGGTEAQFPELGWTLKGMHYDMVTKPEVQAACEKSVVLTKLRDELLTQQAAKIEENAFGYKSTLFMIEDSAAFFDLVVRVNEPDSPVTYHSARFGYNWPMLIESPNHTLLPTMASVTSADLLKIRGVEVGLIGVSTDTITVDGFPQTPYEFFMHDVDHTRRMHEETKAAVEREGVTPQKYAEDADQLFREVLLPAIDLEGIVDPDDRDRRIAMRMILFEILHEDATDPTRDSIADAILREPMTHTPFERTLDGNIVEHFMAPRATTLAHVYRKLAHTFYDFPEQRSSSLGTDFVRTRTAITQGAADLYRLVSDDPIDQEALMTSCRALVSTDEGFTDAFIGNFAHDINRRGVGRSALKLMISRPLGVSAAVRQVRKHAEKIHSLFGYSALEYEDPELLEQTVLQDLGVFDPGQTAIAIGATPYGIGRLYPLIKDLGFTTLGIVASTAIGQNEECAEGVDSIIVVKDNGWGGHRYTQSSAGLLSPTTRVFVGASDSIAAYGGGNITAVSMQEMLRRDKPVSFTPFDMNHRIAQMSQAQRGDSGDLDYAGPANAAWQRLAQS